MNAPPPFAAAWPGKRRKLPRPTADPATARITPRRVPHSCFCSVIHTSRKRSVVWYGDIGSGNGTESQRLARVEWTSIHARGDAGNDRTGTRRAGAGRPHAGRNQAAGRGVLRGTRTPAGAWHRPGRQRSGVAGLRAAQGQGGNRGGL